MLGGSPLRLLRVTDAGAAIVDSLRRTGRVDDAKRAAPLLRRLVDTGIAHPIPALRDPAHYNVAVVIPVRDDTEGIALLTERLHGLDVPMVIVDDGSRDPDGLRRAIAGRAATTVRHETSLGPAAARNTGWQSVDADFIVFLDADVTPEPGWLATLLGHFADPNVAAAAPRVAAPHGASVLARYERDRSPLDLGAAPGRVAPRTRISYAPSAALVVRRDVLDDLGGFEEALRVGEDVDLLWRIVEAGYSVRYEPRAVVTHRNRESWPALLRQRFGYASAAAGLDARHPGDVAPAEVNIYSLLAWLLPAAFGRRGLIAGTLVAAGSVAALVPKLSERVDRPMLEAARLGGLGHLFAGRLLATAAARAWLPIAAPATLFSRTVRRSLAVALAAPALAAWFTGRRNLDPVRYTAAHIADDVAYCAGLWQGMAASRSFRALLPRLSGIPGLRAETRRPSR